MAIPAETKEYADLLFEREKKKLQRERDEAVATLSSGLTNKADILARVGIHNFVQPELTYLEAIARARAQCLESAHTNNNGTLDQETIDEILTDTGYQLESIAVMLLSNVQHDSELLAGRTSTNVNTRVIGEISNELANRRADVMDDIRRGLKIKAHESRLSAARSNQSAKAVNSALVFVSCGQSTQAERDLGKRIATLVEQEAGCAAYFAENQNNFQGVTENILKKLNEAVAFIAIMHPRGDVSNPHNPDEVAWIRGSVWVEQEIAIAAFVSQALDRSLEVRAYIHRSIRREGLRDKLHLNPKPFENDSEILADLKTFLPEWRKLGSQPKQGMSLKPRLDHRPTNIPGGSNDPEDERQILMATVENDGQQDARDFRLDVEFPIEFHDNSGSILVVPSSKPGFVTYRVDNKHRQIQHLYPGDKAFDDLITIYYFVPGKTKRERPESLQQSVIATVFSGNMQPRKISKTIAELLG